MNILLVEDNPAHAELVKRSFSEHELDNAIHHVSDGAEALDYLYRRGEYADPDQSPMPTVILLDLRLPKVSGMEVLAEIKESQDLRKIPVVILTTSDQEPDIAKAYELHANSYLIKPVDFKMFTQLMNEIGVYWLERNAKS